MQWKLLRKHRALGAGYYREYAPSPDLRELVACHWLSVVGPRKVGAHTPIIPDGCSDIMLYDADEPRVVGPDTRMRWAELREGLVITGLRLRPGAWRVVFGCSAHVLLDGQAWLRDLRGVSTRFLDALNFADTLRGRQALLEDWVRQSMLNVSADDRLLLSACRQLSLDAQLPVGVLAKRLGWHARMMHRQFLVACGYGPKHLQRVMRVQVALQAARSGSQARSLADLACVAGFVDQAHMTRDFKDLTGFTPATYLKEYTPEVGSWLTAGWSPDLMSLSESFGTAAE